MTEYWVSQARYYCKFCNAWMGDNKPSRQHHDNGVKHKQMVELYHKKKREEKFGGMHSEREMAKQLAEIDKAARDALLEDRATNQGMFHQNVGRSIPTRPPPPPRFDGNSNSKSNDNDNIEEDLSGIYKVRGQTYLEGQKHVDKIFPGIRCEAFVEEADEWLPVVIESRREVPVPNTELKLKHFTISYSTPKKDGVAQTTREEGVKCDRIRILADDEGNALRTSVGLVEDIGFAAARYSSSSSSSSFTGTGEGEGEELVRPKKREIVEATGLGAWETVSVTVVDEEREEEERAMRVLEEKAEQEQRTKDLAKAHALAAEEHDDSPLNVADPYKTRMYKGFVLGSDIAPEEPAGSLTQGKIVGFRKRKAPPAHSQLTRAKPSHAPNKASDSTGNADPADSEGFDDAAISQASSARPMEQRDGGGGGEDEGTAAAVLGTSSSGDATAAPTPFKTSFKIGSDIKVKRYRRKDLT